MRMPLTDPDDQKSIDIPLMEKMTDAFLEAGFRYCDTGWMYHDFMSEPTARKVLVDRYPEECYSLAAKMPLGMIHSREEALEIYEKQKTSLGVERFEYYLFHNMNVRNYETARKYDLLSFLQKKQEEGEIKHLGMSCHDNAAFLDHLLSECPFIEFVQLQINYLDWESEGIQSRKCYETCVRHGKTVIVMEPVKGGTLSDIPEDVEKMLREVHPDWSPSSWALRFAASLPAVRIVLSGMSNMQQMEENISTFRDMEPLNEEELSILRKAAEMLQASVGIPCTGCRYCVEEIKCPKGILIPNYFSLYNTEKLRIREDWSPEKNYYADYIKQGHGRASECISCRQCERVCPQGIAIAEFMKEVKRSLEDDNSLINDHS